MRKNELEALLSEVDRDGSGEVEYLEFLEIMTVTLQRLQDDREEAGARNEGQVMILQFHNLGLLVLGWGLCRECIGFGDRVWRGPHHWVTLSFVYCSQP
jgi:hypothetical protein